MNRSDLRAKMIPIKLADLVVPHEGQTVMLDRWWMTDGENVFVFAGHAPQCNTNPDITRMFAKMYDMNIVFVPVAFYSDASIGVERVRFWEQ